MLERMSPEYEVASWATDEMVTEDAEAATSQLDRPESTVIDLAAARERVAAQFEPTLPRPQSDEPLAAATRTTASQPTPTNECHTGQPVTDAQQPRLRPAKPETHEKEPRFSVRPATLADIDDMVDVDVRTFESVYTDYELTSSELREDMRRKLITRFEKVGGEWMPVLVRDDRIVGFMACCPTSKQPEDFTTWEEMTDDGTLETAYDRKGKNIYVITLSVLPEGSEAKDMLFMNQMGKMLREGYDLAFFESRLPRFRSWVQRRAGDPDAVPKDKLQTLAETYYATRIGKDQVPLEPLLRLYERVGCQLGELKPDAYQDVPSMNYGVVCTFNGDVFFDGSMLQYKGHHIKLPENRLTRWAFGFCMQSAANSLKLTRALFQ